MHKEYSPNYRPQISDRDKLKLILHYFEGLGDDRKLKSATFAQLISFIKMLNLEFSEFGNNGALSFGNKDLDRKVRLTALAFVISQVKKEAWSNF
jgi:hypothetical protein